MRRREFIGGLGYAAVAWPLAARAQQQLKPVIGYLSVTSREIGVPYRAAMLKGMSEVGFVDGQNVSVEYRYANGRYDLVPAMAAELVNRNVNLIATPSSAKEASDATTRIPIVAAFNGDPIRAGLVTSLSHPGGNLTGVSILGLTLGSKRLEVIREILPAGTLIALLRNPKSTDVDVIAAQNEIEAAARVLGQRLLIVDASTEAELRPAFDSIIQRGAGGLMIIADPALSVWLHQLVALADRHKIPTIWNRKDFAEAGGLISYGSDFLDAFRLLGVYVGRVLAGAPPGELPIIQATKVELTINLKTAKSLGITFPLSLLGRADEVIE